MPILRHSAEAHPLSCGRVRAPGAGSQIAMHHTSS
jgi:hypothetical protein